MSVIIGIDPDSEAHGVAVYENGKLSSLHNFQLLDVLTLLANLNEKGHKKIRFAVEDVCANNFIYRRNMNKNERINDKIALSVGRCQQAQTELIRGLQAADVPYSLFKPQKGNWAKNPSQFKLATGWRKRSNEDQRSAAYFGYLELHSNKPRSLF